MKLKLYDTKLCLLDIILLYTTKKLPKFFFIAIPREEALKKVVEYGVLGQISKPFNLKDFQLIYDYRLDK